MKLVRFGSGTKARLGVVVGDQVVDVEAALTAAIAGSGASTETAATQARERLPSSMRELLAAGAAGQAALKEAVAFGTGNPTAAVGLQPVTFSVASAQLLAPVGDPQKIICIGQNYRDHCLEQNQPFPERAIIFAKFPTALNDPGAPIVLPHVSEKVDYEAELAFVVGKTAKLVSEADAPGYIGGYMCFNDVSARDIQMHPAEKQWIRGKSPDTFAPCGPMLVTADEIQDPHDLDISLTLNGQSMQCSNTSNLIFNCFYLLSHLSQTMTLLPGDIVATGTPGGVGAFRNPPVFLKPGDEVSVTIEGLGTLTNPVAAP